MILVCIQDNLYLTWQAELLIYNVHKLNPNENITILSGFRGRPSDNALSLEKRFKNVYLMEDTRTNMGYAPSIQPHLIQKYLEQNLHSGDYVFLIDSDVHFKSLDTIKPIPGHILYSDTSSYIDATYINGCDPDMLKEMCNIVNVDYDFVMSCDHRSGGAHYLFCSIFDATFWKDIEDNSNKLYDFMCNYKCKIHEIQKWTASMWAILWAIYRQEMCGFITANIHPSLQFCWATDHIDRFDQTDILHMAGVTEQINDTHFYKGDYVSEPPWDKDLKHVRNDLCCYKYVEFINEYSKVRQDFTTK